MAIRKHIKVSKKAGLPPGAFLHIGATKTKKNTVDLISYNEQEIQERSETDFNKIIPLLKNETINWLNIDGLHNVELIEKTGKYFQLHPLNIEDILNTQHHPKLEEHDDYLLFSLKMLGSIEENIPVFEQISIVVGKNFVLTFLEKETELFNRIKERLHSQGVVRKKNADYLFYRIADTVVDSYYVVLDGISDRMEQLEETIYVNSDKRTFKEIQNLKKDIATFRKSIYPVREGIGRILQQESEIIEKSTIRYFSDVYDHAIHIVETLESYRDLAAGISEMHIAHINYKMNEVIKVLTVISTVFIPLTFIVGVYGMNFDFMPELSWRWGYPSIMFLMFFISFGMLFFMKRKKWF